MKTLSEFGSERALDWSKKPVQMDGFWGVTDGYSMITRKADVQSDGSGASRRLAAMLKHEAAAWDRTSMEEIRAWAEQPPCDKCKGERKIVCPHCHGTREVWVECDECDHTHRHKCSNCDEDGKGNCPCTWAPRYGLFGSRGIDLRKLSECLEYMPETGAADIGLADKDTMLVIETRDYTLRLMGMTSHGDKPRVWRKQKVTA